MPGIPTISPKAVRQTPEGCSDAVGRGSELRPVLSSLHRHHSGNYLEQAEPDFELQPVRPGMRAERAPKGPATSAHEQ